MGGLYRAGDVLHIVAVRAANLQERLSVARVNGRRSVHPAEGHRSRGGSCHRYSIVIPHEVVPSGVPVLGLKWVMRSENHHGCARRGFPLGRTAQGAFQ